MGQIQVFIPDRGPTVAVPSQKAVIWGESLDWHVHCDNKSVKKIKIIFEPHKTKKDRAPMFKNKKRDGHAVDKDDHVIVKEIFDDGSGNQTRTCNISGHVPVWKGKHKARLDKYTLVGLDAKDHEVEGTELDPEIITTDPGGD